MAHLPLMLLVVASTFGVFARFLPTAKWRMPYKPQLAAVGGYAAGLLIGWLVLSVLRSICLMPLASQFEFLNSVFSPYHLFRIELWILLFLAIRECTFLGGTYTAITEWKLSLIDGCKATATPIAISTLIFFPSWWILQPGEYGNFRGSFVDALVSQNATAIYSASPSSDFKLQSKLQARSAIPHAIVIATGLAALLLIAFKSIKYTLSTLDQTYLHLPPKPATNNNNSWPFNPRGGGAN